MTYLLLKALHVIMSIGMLLTIIFGLILLTMNPSLFKMGWLHTKLAFVVGLIFYHFYCHKIYRDLRDDNNQRSGKWLRIYNEAPALFLFIIIILAIVKPF